MKNSLASGQMKLHCLDLYQALQPGTYGSCSTLKTLLEKEKSGKWNKKDDSKGDIIISKSSTSKNLGTKKSQLVEKGCKKTFPTPN